MVNMSLFSWQTRSSLLVPSILTIGWDAAALPKDTLPVASFMIFLNLLMRAAISSTFIIFIYLLLFELWLVFGGFTALFSGS